MRDKVRHAFTLVELTIALLIIAILGAIAIPKFMAIRGQAIEANEDTVIGALREASMNYVITHNGVGYDGNVFELLSTAPPNRRDDTFDGYGGDGVHWVVHRVDVFGWIWYYIYSPHFLQEGTHEGVGGDMTYTGRAWVYSAYRPDGHITGLEGTIYLALDYGY